MLKKFLSLILASVIACSLCLSTSAEDINILNDENEYHELNILNLYDSFIESISNQKTSSYGGMSFTYPNDYAGAFYGEDEKLHILLTTESAVGSYKNILNSNNVVYETAKFSLNDLQTLFDAIGQIMDIYEINSCGLRQTDNKLYINVKNPKRVDELINLFNESNVPVEMFEISCNEVEFHPGVYARPGDILKKGTALSENWATIGFNAINTLTSERGIVTADHVWWNTTTVGISGYAFGTKAQSTRSASNDCTFIPFKNNNLSTSGIINNTTLYGSTPYTITASYTSAADLEGISLTGFGMTAKKKTGIKVLDSLYEIHYTNEYGEAITIKNALLTTHYSLGGDSGGPIGAINSDNTMTVAGINSGWETTNGVPTGSCVIKIHNVLSSLNVQIIGYADY